MVHLKPRTSAEDCISCTEYLHIIYSQIFGSCSTGFGNQMGHYTRRLEHSSLNGGRCCATRATHPYYQPRRDGQLKCTKMLGPAVSTSLSRRTMGRKSRAVNLSLALLLGRRRPA